MSRISSTKDKWIALILIPFKFYSVLIVPFYLIFRIVLNTSPLEIKTGENAFKLDGTIEMFLYGYMLCAPCLLLGATLQIVAGNFKSATQTLSIAAVPTLLLLFYVFMHTIQHLL